MSGHKRFERDGSDDAQYDVLLAAIPAVFVVSYLLVTGHVTGRSAALVVASMASGLLILAALFLDPPNDATN